VFDLLLLLQSLAILRLPSRQLLLFLQVLPLQCGVGNRRGWRFRSWRKLNGMHGRHRRASSLGWPRDLARSSNFRRSRERRCTAGFRLL
jgi:hypothetical protein